MLCDECGKRQANVLVSTDVNGLKREMHLCQECAQNHAGLEIFMEPGFTFHNILAGLFDPGGLVSGGQLQYKQVVRCPICGLSFADFRRLGQLGCSKCYETFAAQLIPAIRRIHGSAEHTGKKPKVSAEASRQRKLEELRRQLQEAIAAEAYERAAELRDEIKKLE